MKSASRIRFLHCFKPESSPGNALRRDLSGEPDEHLTYRDIAEESLSPPAKKRTFVRAVKAVLFKAVLARRVRERRRGSSKSYGSMNSGRTVADFLDNEAARDDNTSISRVSRLPSLSEPYSSLDEPSLSSGSQNGMSEHKPKAPGKSGTMRKRMICALVVVLAVTVFFGRSWAVLLASAWICMTCVCISVFRRRNRARNRGLATDKS